MVGAPGAGKTERGGDRVGMSRKQTNSANGLAAAELMFRLPPRQLVRVREFRPQRDAVSEQTGIPARARWSRMKAWTCVLLSGQVPRWAGSRHKGREHARERMRMRNATKYFVLGEARSDGLLNIGRAAEASGVSAKMIRHYESIGLLRAAGRTGAGYRIYGERDIHTLRFIRRARDLGFSMKEIAGLLNLWQNQRRASSEVKKLATKQLQLLDERLEELNSMRNALLNLVSHCHGDERPECPILEDLASDGGRPGNPRRSSVTKLSPGATDRRRSDVKQ
jgi:MerR family transcriptional regulator, copper efflux regulator